MFEVSPVSTNVIFQSWMSLLNNSSFFPPLDRTKSLDTHSSYSRKYFLMTSAL